MTKRMAASAQHCDWEGTVAADDADGVAIRKYLRERALISDKELIVGIKVLVGDGQVDKPSVQVLVIDAVGYDSVTEILRANDTIILRKINLDLSLSQFVGLFKRFSVTFAVPGLEPEEHEYLAHA
jgi:hypothetical protein